MVGAAPAHASRNGGDPSQAVNVHVWAPAFSGFGGGITAFSRELAAALADLGHRVSLFGKTDLTGCWNGLPLRGAGAAPSPLRTAAFATRIVASCVRERPDHVISTHLNFGPAALYARRIGGVPYTLVAHGIDVHGELSPARRAALRAADSVLAVSSWTRRRVIQYAGVAPERVAVLPNTVDEQRFTESGGVDHLRRRYGIGPGERVVLTVARLHADEAYKGYDRVVQALPQVRAACGSVRFVIVGSGGDRVRIEALARACGVSDAVTFAGFVPDEELADHYRLADVFAMPSTGEGFGIVFLEAMACGTPVLAGDRDGSADALDSGRLGRLIDPTDVGAIATGIVELLEHRGPDWWFSRSALRAAVIERFGRAAFRRSLTPMFAG